MRITARWQGGAAATVAGQLLEAVVSHDSMAWAAATALSRGFNLQRQDFDGGNRAMLTSDRGGAQRQGTCCCAGSCRLGFLLLPSCRLPPADDADASDWQDEWGAANTLLVPWVDMLNHSGDAGERIRGTVDVRPHSLTKHVAAADTAYGTLAAAQWLKDDHQHQFCFVQRVMCYAMHAGEESCLRGHRHTACLAAHRDYAAGEEVFNTYGPW